MSGEIGYPSSAPIVGHVDLARRIHAQVESFMAARPDLERLFPVHYEKLALNKDKVPLSPQWGVYETFERQGNLLFIALRDGWRLIGYWVAVIAPGLHYSTCLTATLDMWFIAPGYENGVGALILMRAVEREYRRRGVQRAIANTKLHTPCDRVYRLFGYEPVEMTFSKWMGS